LKKVSVRNMRKFEFDYLRIVAIILVVVCHSVAVIYPYLDSTVSVTQNFAMLSNLDKVFSTLMFVIGRLGVSFFFMLSGYFIISRLKLTEDEVIVFYKQRFFRLLITFELWMVFYEIFVRLFLKLKSGLLQILFELLFISKTPNYPNALNNTMWQIWFIPTILGIYLFMPLLVIFIKGLSVKIQSGLIFVAVIIDFVIPTLNSFFKILSKNVNISTGIDHGFIGTSFGVYVLIGGLIKQGWLTRVSSRILRIISVVGFGSALGMQYIINQLMTNAYFIWYDNFFILITTVAIFELVNRIKLKKKTNFKGVTLLSNLSLGVYLIHRPVQIIIQKYLFLTNYSVINFFINLLVTCFISFLLVYLLSRIRILDQYLFYNK